MVPEALTPDEIAARLDVPPHEAARWIAAGLLPVAAVNAEGVPLVFDHWLELNGAALKKGQPTELRSNRLRAAYTRRHEILVQLCGCVPSPENGRPTILCTDARSLQSAVRLAAAFAAAAPDDALFGRLAAVTVEPLARHLGNDPNDA